jgi:hypothetical protein
MATDYSTEEILNIWERGDKDTTDLFRLVKDLDLDRDVDPTDWLKENLRKKGDEGKAFREYDASWYRERLKEYYDAQEQLQTAKGQYQRGKYQDTKIKDLATGEKYTKQPGTRGIPSTSAEFYSKQRDRAHKKLMKIKEEEKRLAEEKKGLSIWQRMGKHLGENAAARDKFFTTIGSIGRELVKPIQPGQAAAGALLPTLSRGLEAGEEAYATKQAAETKRMLDMASARQKINPMQYYSNKMNEARLMVPEGTPGGADGAAGKAWIGNYLRSIGIPSQVVDLGNTITEQQILLTTAPADQKELIQKNINEMLIQQNNLLNQMMGGGSTDSNTIAYLGG